MKNKCYAKLISFFTCTLMFLFHATLFGWIWYNIYLPGLMIPFYRKGSYLMFLLYITLLVASNQIFGGLRLGYYKTLDSIIARTLSLFATNSLIYIVISLLSYRLVVPIYMLLAIGIGFLFNLLWTQVSNWLYYKVTPPRQMLLIHGDRAFDEVYHKITARSEKFEIIKRVHCNAGEEKLKQIISKYEAVILHDLSAELRNHLIKYCYEHSIRVYVTPKLYDILIRGASDMDLFDTPFLLMRNHGLSRWQAFVKRCMDLLISITCLIITSPLLLLIILLMKLFDKGPIFYHQTRLTLDGKEFEIYKFRSMYVDAEKDSIRLMRQGDDRITPLGRILRRAHLDELPQLINIIKGDMSFVGPRPERPEIAKIYMAEIPEFSYRLKVKAGLTGYAQVYGKYNSTPYDKLKLDLTYIQNYSAFLDLKLLLLTWKTLFIPDHAEGVSSAFTTALRETAATANPVTEATQKSENATK